MSTHDLTDEIRSGAASVMEGNLHVQIDGAALTRLATQPCASSGLPLAEAPVPSWNTDLHYFDGTARTALYLLLLDATNFCFWPERFIVEYRGQRYGEADGYDALAVAWRRAFEGGLPVDDVRWLRDLTEAEFRALLYCVEGEVPLLAERLQNVRLLAEWLLEDYGGQAANLLAAAKGSAPALVSLLSACPAYRDIRTWNGRPWPVMKRAQIFVSDLAGSFRGHGLGELSGLDRLTCFADYKLPQLFHNDGVFVYAAALDAAVRGGEEIPADSPEETSIRAATIVAVERLKAELSLRGRDITSRELGLVLSSEAALSGRLLSPSHRTVTVDY